MNANSAAGLGDRHFTDPFELLDHFDHAWQSGPPPVIDEFLKIATDAGLVSDSDSRRRLLVNLVQIDLDQRWRHLRCTTYESKPRLPLDHYLLRFPELGPVPALELILDEYRVRTRWGDHPTHDSYRERYPTFAEDLAGALSRIDAELAAEPNRPSPSTHHDRDVHSTPHPSGFAVRPDQTALPDIPGYEILGVLGRGGMGVVYKARQKSLNRMVAIKMIIAGFHAGEAERSRFRKEAETIAALKHANIVEVHDFSEHQDVPFLVLEYVEGGSLARRLDGNPISATEAGHITLTLARAVHNAHRHGVVHRDIKPANILITDDGRLKLTDFGLAKHLACRNESASGGVVGTPAYMAPEQAEGHTSAIGPATDVYALGAVLYELLTGRPPFQGDSLLAVLHDVCVVAPIVPSQLNPLVPPALDRICLLCLEKDPNRRFRDAAGLAQDLEDCLAQMGKPIDAVVPKPKSSRPLPLRRRLLYASLIASGVATIMLMLVLLGPWIAGIGQRPKRVDPGSGSLAEEPLESFHIGADEDLNKVVEECTQQIQRQPDRASAYLRRAVANYYITLRETDVMADCTKALEYNPRLAAAHAFRAGAYVDLAQVDKGLEDCEAALRIDSKCSVAYAFRALARIRKNDYGPALADCAESLRLDPNEALAHSHRGLACAQLNEHDKAITAFTEAILLLPQFVWPYHHRAYSHLQRSEFDACISDETTAIRLSPHWYRSYQNRGRANLARGENDLAIHDLTEATRLDPTDALPLKLRGDAYRAKGQLGLACEDYRKARDLDPDLQVPVMDVNVLMSQGLAAIDRNDLDGATSLFRGVIALDPKHAAAHDRLGWICLYRCGSKSIEELFKAAIVHFGNAVSCDAKLMSAYHGRARANWGLKRTTEAIEDFASAIRCAPKNTALIRERGDRYMDLDQRDKAFADYERMIELEPNDADHYEHRASVFRIIGQEADAQKDLAKAKELRHRSK
jgi:tetratricopeptide (TPR) repeat protein/tRNA A-37 threonylcarbamoyl transferase component Bud32